MSQQSLIFNFDDDTDEGSDTDKENTAPAQTSVGNSRHRNWVFTLNNYTRQELEKLREVFCPGGPFTYVAFQGEIGENGTKHLQGVICRKNPGNLQALRSKVSNRAHFEVMRGTIEQAVTYCSKEDTRDPDGPSFIEYGERPIGAGAQGSRSDLVELANRVKSGANLKLISDEFPSDFLRYSNGIQRLIALNPQRRMFKTEVYWFHGPTGTGKSKTVYEMINFDSFYVKNPTHKWWDGYFGQDDIIIDDYRADFMKFAELLRLFDRYPMQLEVKCGTVEFTSKRIFLTSPRGPEETWAARSTEDLRQLTRRIEHVKYFGDHAFNPNVSVDEIVIAN